MSDAAAPVSPILAAAMAAAPAAQTPAQPAPAAPVVDAAPPPAALAAEAPAAPAAPVVNPWALRPSKPAAPALVVETSAAAAPVAPVDPKLADLEARVASLSSVLTRQASAELAAVPENVRAYVSQIAGTDAAKQLDALHAMRAAGLVPATPAAVPTGATTMSAPSAPPAAPVADPDSRVLAEYERLASSSPIMAAAFRTTNSAAITRATAARASRN